MAACTCASSASSSRKLAEEEAVELGAARLEIGGAFGGWGAGGPGETLFEAAVLGTAGAVERTGTSKAGARLESGAIFGSAGPDETAAETSAAPTETPSSAPRTPLSPEPAPEMMPFVAGALPMAALVRLAAMVS